MLHDDAHAIFAAAVQRVQAASLLDESDPFPDDIDRYDRVRVVGMGKAALAMASAVESRLPVTDGCVVVPKGYPQTRPDDVEPPRRVEVLTGGHPAPSFDSVRAARRIQRIAASSGPDDLLVVLVSGGGTTLAALPVDEVDVEDVQDVAQKLLLRGVPIAEANAVRKHLLQLGGGQLAREAAPATVAAAVVSDVVGDDLSTIASGPTVPDPTTYQDAVRTLYRYDLWHDVTAPVREHLAAGARRRRPETVKEGADCFARTTTTLVGTNRMALAAAAREAESRGYRTRIVTDALDGEARDVGRAHAKRLLDAASEAPLCLLWGGETTVTVTGTGTGGRNQEAALAAALELDAKDTCAVFLSAGTDGIDGPTDAAGAWATPDTIRRATDRGLDAPAHLDANDSYSFFDALDQLLRPGPTHTNVMDVQIGLVRPQD